MYWSYLRSEEENCNIKFEINSLPEVDQGAAKILEGFARSEHQNSWKEVLDKFVKQSGGEETDRKIEITDPEEKDWLDASYR